MGCQVCWDDTLLQGASLYVHSSIKEQNRRSLRDVHIVARLAGRRLVQNGHEFVAPVDLRGQVGLPRHEWVAELCCPLKGYNQLCIYLRCQIRFQGKSMC